MYVITNRSDVAPGAVYGPFEDETTAHELAEFLDLATDGDWYVLEIEPAPGSIKAD